MTTLGDLIRTRREALGMKQGELADAVGTSRAYMSQIEAGKLQWPQNLIPELSRVLRVSQVELAVAAGLIAAGPEPQLHANPFERTDPRWQFVEALKQLNLNDEYDAYVAVTAYTMLRTMQTGSADFRRGIVETYRSSAKRG